MGDISVGGIRDIIGRAEGNKKDSGMITDELSASLGAALASLKDQFGVDNNFVPPGGQGAAYAKMFSEVAENFSSLFSELSAMRSSYLPFELAQEIPTLTGGEKTLEEVVDAEAVKESYENAFFRMLGMPSTSDLNPDEPLIAVESSGVLIAEEDNLTYDGNYSYMDILDVRQLSNTSRPGAPTNAIYDFLSASISSFSRLEKAGFVYVPELQDIVDIMKELEAAETANENTLIKSQELQGIISNNANIEDDTLFKSLTGEIAAYLDGFDPNSGITIVMSKRSLNHVIFLALQVIEPALVGKYTDDLISSLWNREVLGKKDPTMQQFVESENFWKFSYLLFPPVQDGRVAKCINEPKKMVASPFSPSTLRTVNGRKLKSTLLEAVIRIRLDIISGTTVNAPVLGETNTPPVTVGTSDVPITYSDIANSMGLIESLMITRLFSALHGFALDVKQKITDLQSLQHQSGYAPPSGSRVTGDNTRTAIEKKEYCEADNAKEPGSKCQLETMKTIEESLLLILGDSQVPEVLEMQEGVARSGSIKSAHLMSAALAVMDVPRRWVSSQIEKKEEEQKRLAQKAQDETQAQIASKIGVSKGVGAVDLLAFIIAFFTAKEETLLCLLTEGQFADLVEEFPDGFFDDLERKDTIAQAVNDIALRVYDVYQLFRFAVNREFSTFTHSTEVPDAS